MKNEREREREREGEEQWKEMEKEREREREREWKRDLLPNYKLAKTRVYKKKVKIIFIIYMFFFVSDNIYMLYPLTFVLL